MYPNVERSRLGVTRRGPLDPLLGRFAQAYHLGVPSQSVTESVTSWCEYWHEVKEATQAGARLQLKKSCE